MKIYIIAIGKGKKSAEQELADKHLARFNAASKTLGFGATTIIEVEEKRPLKGAERQAREADLLRGVIPSGAEVIALDERGKPQTSAEFARWLASLRDQGTRDLVFLIGGADGFHQDFKNELPQKISFGSATWPHMMVRAMLTEQLYRAATILSGHPYHKD